MDGCVKKKNFFSLFHLFIFLFFSFFQSFSLAQEEEIDWNDVADPPTIHIVSPNVNESYDKGNLLHVVIEGKNTSSIEVILDWGEDQITLSQKENTFDFTFHLPQLTTGLTLTAIGYGNIDGKGYPMSIQKTREVPSPKEGLIYRMFQLAFENSKDKKYNFAPAQEDHHIGLCKNYVMRLFDTFSQDYGMAAYPDLPLYMPKNNSMANCAPFDYGIEWRYEFAEEGSPFEISAQFKYNDDLTKEENAALAREMMESIEAGDFFQMTGYFVGGSGAHSLVFMSDYDPQSDNLHWTDSNMFGTRIDGVRWGYLQYNVVNTAQWFVDAINTSKHGATVYRLRDDLFRR